MCSSDLDPHHPKSIHHGGQSIDDCLEGSAMCDVLKMPLQSREEPHIILSLSVILVEVGTSVLNSVIYVSIQDRKSVV